MRASSDQLAEDARRFERLHFALDDFHQAMDYVGQMLRSRLHFRLVTVRSPRRHAAYIKQTAFNTALVVCYMRPFSLGKRFPKLTVEELGYTAEQQELHERIHNLRDKVYAHKDGDVHSAQPLDAGAPNRAMVLVSKPHEPHLTREELFMLLRMLETAHLAIVAETYALSHSIGKLNGPPPSRP